MFLIVDLFGTSKLVTVSTTPIPESSTPRLTHRSPYAPTISLICTMGAMSV